jgi:hypothetical protein
LLLSGSSILPVVVLGIDLEFGPVDSTCLQSAILGVLQYSEYITIRRPYILNKDSSFPIQIDDIIDHFTNAQNKDDDTQNKCAETKKPSAVYRRRA